MNVSAAITEALARVPASTGDNLLGFQIDLDAYLSSDGVGMSNVEVTQSGDPRCALVATCVAAPGLTAEDLSEVLVEVWLNKLSYNCWEVHEVIVSGREVRLCFVTVTGWAGGDICVTGEIKAEVASVV